MTFKGFFVDDSPEDAVFARLLSSDIREGLDLDYLKVEEAGKLSAYIFETGADIVLLDFRLDENPEMVSPQHAYKGSGLAQLLRDKAVASPANDFPIVLVSAENKFNAFFRPDRTAHDLFDRAYGKEHVHLSESEIQNELISLCEGYKLLKSVWTTNRMDAFALTEDDYSALDHQELTYPIMDASAPHIAARVILKTLIEREGILISLPEATARLGADPSQAADVEKLLQQNNLAYSGVFSNGWPRWFGHRFDSWIEDLLGRRPSNLTGTEKCNIINQKTGLKLAPAKSTWNGSPDEKFIFSCASCHRPTEIRHSLAAFDPLCPRHGQRKRICWDCIQTDKYTHCHLNIDNVDRDLVEDVKHRQRT